VIADEYAVNARNPYKNRMHSEGIHRTGWYNNRTEIDYRGSDVTVQMFMDALLGEAPKSLKNLNAESNLMIYVTGHGGDQFFKFQDEVRGTIFFPDRFIFLFLFGFTHETLAFRKN
jgi:phosphatidylinositol glycan class K